MDTSISIVPTPTDAVAAQAPEVQEDATVIPEVELDLPSDGIKNECSSSIKEEDAVQDSSPSNGFVDAEVQPEVQELEEAFNTNKGDSGVVAANIQPEALPSQVNSSFFTDDLFIYAFIRVLSLLLLTLNLPSLSLRLRKKPKPITMSHQHQKSLPPYPYQNRGLLMQLK